ncbi:MAG: phosphatidylinositol-specific phospholipase C [Burkholderiales bacterium]|nr:phosphatidylinositol-specific phospholipase C [Burkholderiales bacterium]
MFAAHSFSRRFFQFATAFVFSLAASHANAHNHSAYSHDAQVNAYHADWMQGISGDKALRDISIPGTHDTMSFYGGDIVQTQSMSLDNQLMAGIRMLDIRCRRIDNKFAIHHGFVYQHANFDDVLQAVTRFLAAHPSETVMMRVSEEYDVANSNLSFAEIFTNYANDARYSQYFWRGNNSDVTLNNVRGKIVVMRNFSGIDFGIPYGSMQAQDAYNMTTNWDLYSKWEKVKNHLNTANNAQNLPAAQHGFYINYLSASGGSFPYFVVSGHSSPGTGAPRLATGLTTPGWKNSYPDFPRVSCFIGICTIAFEGTNVLTYDYLNRIRFSGVIMTDFPGAGLIGRIIELNQKR